MPPQRKLFDHATEPLDEMGKGVPEVGWRYASWLVQQLGDTVVEVVVIGVSERKLLINDNSKKASFL